MENSPKRSILQLSDYTVWGICTGDLYFSPSGTGRGVKLAKKGQILAPEVFQKYLNAVEHKKIFIGNKLSLGSYEELNTAFNTLKQIEQETSDWQLQKNAYDQFLNTFKLHCWKNHNEADVLWLKIFHDYFLQIISRSILEQLYMSGVVILHRTVKLASLYLLSQVVLGNINIENLKKDIESIFEEQYLRRKVTGGFAAERLRLMVLQAQDERKIIRFNGELDQKAHLIQYFDNILSYDEEVLPLITYLSPVGAFKSIYCQRIKTILERFNRPLILPMHDEAVV